MTLGLGTLDAPGEGPPPLVGVGVARRAVARFVDLVVMLVAFAAGSLVAVLGAGVLASDGSTFAAIELLSNLDSSSGWFRLWDTALSLIALTAMHTLCEGLHGSTPGKRLLGIRVVARDGGPAGLGAALKRSVGFLVDQLFFGLVGIHRILQSSDAQRIGDEWADTLVVRFREAPPESRPSTRRFLAAGAAGLAGCGLVALVSTGFVIGRFASQTARDGVRILSVKPKGNAALHAGQPATFALSIGHTLASAPAGQLRLYVASDDDVTNHGIHAVTGASGTTRLEATATMPAALPGYSDPPLPRFIVELYPARNEESPSAEHVLELERVRCDPPDATPGREAGVARGLLRLSACG